MEITATQPMHVTCEHCKSQLKTDDLNDFREYGHTYPPTIMFVCLECKDESRVFNAPARLLQHMAMKISKERGYNSNYRFDNGVSVTAN